MDIDKLKKQFKERDRVIRVMSKDGFFRAVAIKNTNMAQHAQTKHELDALPAFFLARTLAAAALMSAFLKGEERVSIDIESNGIIKRIFAEAIQVGETRGFVRFDEHADTTHITNLGDALGKGKMRVTRTLYNQTEPVTGIIELVNGDIATDLAYFYRQSEQTPSAVLLDVSMDENGKIKQSGGIILQAMPDAPIKSIVDATQRLYELPPLTKFLEEGMNPEELIRQAVDFDFEVIKNSPVDFFCRCTKESFITKLITLGAEEINDMRRTGQNEVVCQYCNGKHLLEDKDFDRMVTEIQAKNN